MQSEGDGPTVTNELSRAGSGGGEKEGEFHGCVWLVKFWYIWTGTKGCMDIIDRRTQALSDKKSER